VLTSLAMSIKYSSHEGRIYLTIFMYLVNLSINAEKEWKGL